VGDVDEGHSYFAEKLKSSLVSWYDKLGFSHNGHNRKSQNHFTVKAE